MTLKAENKIIDTLPIARLFTNGEKNIDTVDIVVDRYYNGVDLSVCKFIMKGVNSNGDLIEQILSCKTIENTINLTWNITEYFTAVSGKLFLEVRGVIFDNNNAEQSVVKYTATPIYINESDIGSNAPTINVTEQAINTMHAALADAIEDYNNAGYHYVLLTQTEYNALASPDTSKLYVITSEV